MRLLDELGGHLKHVTEYEFLSSIITELARFVFFLGLEQGVEICPVECRDYRIAEIGEEIAQVEREFATGLQKVIGQTVKLARRRSQHHHKIGFLATVPTGSEPGFIGIAKGHMILEGDQLKAPFTDSFEDTLLEK